MYLHSRCSVSRISKRFKFTSMAFLDSVLINQAKLGKTIFATKSVE